MKGSTMKECKITAEPTEQCSFGPYPRNILEQKRQVYCPPLKVEALLMGIEGHFWALFVSSLFEKHLPVASSIASKHHQLHLALLSHNSDGQCSKFIYRIYGYV